MGRATDAPPGSERDPDLYKRVAIGGVELELKPHFILNPRTRLPVGLAFTLPTATGDSSDCEC